MPPGGKRIGHDRSQHQDTQVQKDQCTAGIQKAVFLSCGGNSELEGWSGLFAVLHAPTFSAESARSGQIKCQS